MKNLVAALILVVITAPSYAGKGKNKNRPDSLQGYRLFTTLARDWQHAPLQVAVSVTNTSNMVTSPADTATQEGAFYLRGKGAYVRFADMEQLLDDSTALMVSDGMRRMVLFSGAGQLAGRMRDMMAAAPALSSIDALTKKFTISPPVSGGGTLGLRSRATVPGTAVPLEELEVLYDPGTNLPRSITSTRRVAIPLDAGQYRQVYEARPQLRGALVEGGEGKFWVVKENTSIFRYLGISHDPNLPLPVIMADRLSREPGGSPVPAKGFEGYELTDETLGNF